MTETGKGLAKKEVATATGKNNSAGKNLSVGRRAAAGKRLLRKRRSAAYARKLFCGAGRKGMEADEEYPGEDTVGEEALQTAFDAGEEAAGEGARLLSRFYQKAAIRQEYEAISRGMAGKEAVNPVSRAFPEGIRPVVETAASRLKKALDGERIAGKIGSFVAGRSHFLLLFGAVFLSLSVLLGTIASIPLILQGGTTIAVQNVPRYQIPPEYLTDERFARMIEEGEKYLGYPYVWGGDSPLTGFDCSGYVSWVLNHSGNGWSFGRLTANELLAVCNQIPRKEAKPGDLVFFQGTYDTYGASHLGIYVGDNVMLHCGDPIQYTRIDTEEWRLHYLCFGRVRDP